MRVTTRLLYYHTLDGVAMELAPMVYEHAAQLIGETPWRVSRNAELLVAAHAAAYRCYRHAPVVVGIDIYNIEAEAYGARVDEPPDIGVPTINTPMVHTLCEIGNLPLFDPSHNGRMRMLLAVGQRLTALFPEAEVRIPVSGPVSVAGQLLGLEPLLYEMLDDADAAGAALRHLVQGQLRWCRAIAAAGLAPMAFDSAASPPIISPSLFREVVLPVLRFFFREMRAITGAPAPCIIGGDTAPIAADLATLDTDYLICPAETDQSAFLATLAPYRDMTVRVNMRAGVIAHADRPGIYREIDRVYAIARGRSRACLGTGILPYGTPVEQVAEARRYAQQLP